MPRLGAVLLHGKWDRPEGAIAPLADALREAGVNVLTPPCTWSPRRHYDRSFASALAEASAEVSWLRARGCQHVILGGHSLGANAALACAARHASVDALLMVTPGHLPDLLFATGQTSDALARVQGAPTGKRLRLPDFNQGHCRQLRFEAAIWRSFYDPQGAAVMPRAARALGPDCPVLWLATRAGALIEPDRAYAFDLLPADPQNSWRELDCSHADAPGASAAIIVDWLNRLRQSAWTS